MLIKKRSYDKVGAPSKPFEEKQATAQYLEAKRLKDSASSSKAVFKAAKLAADAEGLKDVSFVYQEVFKNPAAATDFRSSISNPKQGIFSALVLRSKLFSFIFFLELVMMTPAEALAMIIECKMSVETYQWLRLNAIKRNANIYPAYHLIQAYKDLCEPKPIVCSQKVCEIPMQESNDHYTERLLLDPLINARVQDFSRNGNCKLTMVTKYGGDGFSVTRYKGFNFEEKSVFACTSVPVMIKALDTDTNKSCVGKTI